VNDAVADARRLDVLVNNSGLEPGILSSTSTLTADVWAKINEVNLRGPFLLAAGPRPFISARAGTNDREHRRRWRACARCRSSIAYASARPG